MTKTKLDQQKLWKDERVPHVKKPFQLPKAQGGGGFTRVSETKKAPAKNAQSEANKTKKANAPAQLAESVFIC